MTKSGIERVESEIFFHVHTPQSAVSTSGLSELSAGNGQQPNEDQPLQEEEEEKEEREEEEEEDDEEGEELVFQEVRLCMCA